MYTPIDCLIDGVALQRRHNGRDGVQITSLTVVYSTVYSGADQGKHQSSASLAFVRGIHRSPVNSPHKWPVTRKMFPFDDVIMEHLFRLRPHTWYTILGIGHPLKLKHWCLGFISNNKFDVRSFVHLVSCLLFHHVSGNIFCQRTRLSLWYILPEESNSLYAFSDYQFEKKNWAKDDGYFCMHVLDATMASYKSIVRMKDVIKT